VIPPRMLTYFLINNAIIQNLIFGIFKFVYRPYFQTFENKIVVLLGVFCEDTNLFFEIITPLFYCKSFSG